MDVESTTQDSTLFAFILKIFLLTVIDIAVEKLTKGTWRAIQKVGLLKFENMLKRLGFIKSFSLLVMPLNWYNALIADDDTDLLNKENQKEALDNYIGNDFSFLIRNILNIDKRKVYVCKISLSSNGLQQWLHVIPA